MWTCRLISAYVAALLLGGQLLVQSDTCLLRTVPVNVLTEHGQIVTGLSPQNFKASFHHKQVKILSVTPDQSPRHIVIVIDASGSMTSERRQWRYYIDVARGFLAGIPASSLVGLVVFSTHIQKVIPPTNDRNKLGAELVSLEAETHFKNGKEGQTALWDSLSAVASDLFPLQSDDSLYVFTDGRDNSSKSSFSKLWRTALEKQVRFFVFSVDMSAFGGGPTPEESIPPKELQDLADATGGYAVHVSHDAIGKLPSLTDKSGTPSGVALLLLMQFRQVYSFNRVQVELVGSFEKSQNWDLKTNALTAHNLVIVYPHVLEGCKSSLQSTNATR